MRRLTVSLPVLLAAGVLCVPTGVAQAQADAPDDAAVRAHIRVLQSDLRNLVTAQEAFFADNMAYAPSIPAMGGMYFPSRGASVAVLTLSETGWNAVAIHEDAPGYVCGIFVGMEDKMAPLHDGAAEGEATCKGPDGKRYRPNR